MERKQKLEALSKIRDELFEKALTLRDKLAEKQKAKNEKKKIIDMKIIDETISQTMGSRNEEPKEEESLDALIYLTQNAFGISYRNISKKCIRDKVWRYQAQTITKALSFDLELTVDEKDGGNEILDVTCRFIEVPSNILQEITPWVLAITRTKNFPFLMSVFTEYNEQFILRNKILKKLVDDKFATIDKYTKEGGGIIIYIHSPKNPKNSYAEYLWALRMKKKTKSINHHFVIEGIDEKFVDANEGLIKEFCNNKLKKNDLEKLWASLRVAICEYE